MALTLTPAQLQVGPGASSVGATVVNAARSQIGVTYAWGGGTKDGPSKGIRDGGVADSFGDYNKIGFDCSGLALYSWAKAGVTLPRTSSEQRAYCDHIPDTARVAGDLVFYGSPVHHVAIWTGVNDTIVEAYQSGTTIRETQFRPGGDYVGAGRPGGGSVSSVLGAVTGAGTGGLSNGLSALAGNATKYAIVGVLAVVGIVIVFSQVGKNA